MKKEMILPMTEVRGKRRLSPWDLAIFIGSFMIGILALIHWTETWDLPWILATIVSLSLSALWGGLLLDQIAPGDEKKDE